MKAYPHNDKSRSNPVNTLVIRKQYLYALFRSTKLIYQIEKVSKGLNSDLWTLSNTWALFIWEVTPAMCPLIWGVTQTSYATIYDNYEFEHNLNRLHFCILSVPFYVHVFVTTKCHPYRTGIDQTTWHQIFDSSDYLIVHFILSLSQHSQAVQMSAGCPHTKIKGYN